MMTTDPMGLDFAIYNCRAMRRMKPDPVPEATLLKLVDAANQGPTGSNKQNGRWIIVTDPAQKQKLDALNKRAVDAYIGDPADQPAKMQGIVRAVAWQRDHFAEIPALIVPCIQLDGPPAETYRAGLGAGGSIWPAVQNLLLTARSLGLAGAITTLGLSDRPAAKEVLGLPGEIEPVAIIPVGFPTGKFGTVTRRPVEDIVRWNRW
jgi:nitroreductase